VGEAGIVGKLDRTWFVLGDTACMASENIELGVTIQTLAHQFELDGKFTIFLAQKQPKRLLGIFACEYELESGVPEAIQALRSIGVELVLLTGAKTSIAKGLGTRLSLSLIHSELSSTDKERILSSLVTQQPASAVLGMKWGGKRVQHIVFRKGEAREGVLANVEDMAHLATLITESRTLVGESQRSMLWRNL
jgi:cation transport ATPase